MDGIGLPKLGLIKHWTLLGLNCYLLLSLNFVGIFAQDSPHRLSDHQHSRGQNHAFRASPFDSSRPDPHVEPVRQTPRHFSNSHPYSTKVKNNVLPPPPSIDKVDTIDLSKIPTVNTAPSSSSKIRENSIDRFDAYGDYEYVDADQYPKPIQYHKPLRHRPDGPVPNYGSQRRPQQPQRRVDYNRHPINQYHHPYQNQFRPQPAYGRPPQPQYGAPPRPGFLSNLFGFGDKNDNLQPTLPNNEDPSGGGLFDPLLKLVGLKKNEQISEFGLAPESNHLQQYHDPFEYDYGDYLEGYQNYVTPQRPKTIPERVARWFTGFRIPRNKKQPQTFERVENNQNGIDYSQYESGDDENLIFYNNQQRPGGALGTLGKPGSAAGLYDFGDVVQAIRNNETSAEVVKKFLSAAAALSERSDSNPVFMMWTIPTTILALMGVVYFAGALSIIGYKYMLQGGQGDPSTLLAVAAVFAIPLILGFVFVTSRSAVNGELAVNKIVRGDFRGSMRQDFDGVDFVMDAIFGSSALLGIGWLVSITI